MGLASLALGVGPARAPRAPQEPEDLIEGSASAV